MASFKATVSRSGVGSLGVDASHVQRLFERFPAVTFFHVRDAIGGMFGSHRREWLARTTVKMNPRGMRVDRLSSRTGGASGKTARRSFFYKVFPQSKTLSAGGSLEDITGEAYTSSEVALGLEQGGTRRPTKGRMLAIPIGVTLDSAGRPKQRWRRPSAFRRASPNNELVALTLKRGKLPILYQVKGGKKAAATAGAVSLARGKGKIGGRKRILLPAYLLVRSVTNRPVLRFMATWDALAGDRAIRMKRAADRILEGADSGKSS